MDDTRLTIAEMKLVAHEKLHEETQAAIRTLSSGIDQLVKAEIRREQDSEIFERIFTDIEKTKKELREFKDSVAAAELAAYKGVVLKVGSVIVLLLLTAIAARLV